MKVLFGKPGTGKTRKLLEISADKNIPILAENEARCERILVKASGYGISIPKPILLEELDSSVKTVIVDDINRFFTVKFGVNLEAVSLNEDDKLSVEHI